MRANNDDFTGLPGIEALAAGQFNPTFIVTLDGKKRCVLHKKPGVLLPSAHVVDREYWVIAALGSTGVPTPEPPGGDAFRRLVNQPALIWRFFSRMSLITRKLSS